MRSRKLKLLSVLGLVIAGVTLIGCANGSVSYSGEEAVALEESTTVWTEVPLLEPGSLGTSSGLIELKPRETIENADYIFRGTVVEIKEFEVSYKTTTTGETIVSPYHTVMDVRVEKEYKGVNPVQGDTIRIYYPFTLSITRDSSVTIKDETSYLFITKFLDEEFVRDRNENHPDDKHEQEKYADAYIGEAIFAMAPIVDNTVFIRTDFFDNMSDVLAKSVDAKCDLVPEGFLERKVSTAFMLEDFEQALDEIIKNPSLIPERI